MRLERGVPPDTYGPKRAKESCRTSEGSGLAGERWRERQREAKRRMAEETMQEIEGEWATGGWRGILRLSVPQQPPAAAMGLIPLEGAALGAGTCACAPAVREP